MSQKLLFGMRRRGDMQSSVELGQDQSRLNKNSKPWSVWSILVYSNVSLRILTKTSSEHGLIMSLSLYLI